jgi:2-furoyl-CoA dehydrogenase large subunit
MPAAAPFEEALRVDRDIPQTTGRLEDARLLAGRGRYIDDLPVSSRTLHASILRSAHAHARIRRVEVAPALRCTGVVAAYNGRDIAAVLDPFPTIVRHAPAYRAVAIDKVLYVGEPIAVVLAYDRYAAEDGMAAIDVEYEPLPAVIDPDIACKPDAPLLNDELGSNVVWRQHYRYGDPARAFAAAERTVLLDLTFPKYNSTPLETFGVIAEYLPESDGYQVHSNFQGPFSLMPVMARALRVPENRLRVIISQDIGGSFGIKAMIYPYMALMAACARLSGRPVKWIEDRVEHLLASASGTDRKSTLEAAVGNDGCIQAIRMKIRENVGAYLRAPEPSCVMRSLTTFCGPYRIENGEIDACCVLTNKLPTGLNRGYGGQQHIFSLERLFDRVATDMGISPIEVRRRNFLKKDDLPYRTTTGSYYDSGDYAGCLDKLLAAVKRDQWESEKRRLRDRGQLAGIGLATAIHSAASNIGYVTLALPVDDRRRTNYKAKSGSNDFAHVALDPSGRIRLQIGTAGAGQGHVTSAAQIAAAELGVRVEDVDVIDRIDTEATPWTITSGSYASRFSIVVAGAIRRAAVKLNAHIRAIAAYELDTTPDKLEIADGTVHFKERSNRSVSLRQIAGMVQWNRGEFPLDADIQLHVSESYSVPNLAAPDAENRVNAAVTYGFMADAALVTIDPRTCVPRVLRYAAVHDVGRAINPQLVRGQMAGGIVHGLAGALFEHCDYDESGQMLTASFMDYLCPTAAEAPQMLIEHHNVRSPFTELGTKGAGENSAMSAPAAIARAVDDALASNGVQITELPITPAAIWRLIHKAAP